METELTVKVEVQHRASGISLSFRAFLAIWMSGCCAAASFGQAKDEPAAKPSDAPVRQLLDRMFLEREKLHSGEYAAKGHRVRLPTAEDPERKELIGDIVVDCAFDDRRGLVRWEREEPRLFLEQNSLDEPGTVMPTGYRFLKTPEKCYVNDWRFAASQQLEIEPPNFEPKEIGCPYDVRTFGIMGWSSVESTVTLQRVKDRFADFSDIDLKELDGGEFEIHCAIGRDVRSTWRIDTARGYTMTYSQLDAFDKTANEWIDGIAKSEVDWVERNSVWVPITLALERRFGCLETYEIELKWESVNEPLSADEFVPEALKLPPGTHITKKRPDGKAVTVGYVGDKK